MFQLAVQEMDYSDGDIYHAIKSVESFFKIIGMLPEAQRMKNTMINYYRSHDMTSFVTEYLRYKYMLPTIWHLENNVAQLLFDISSLSLSIQNKVCITTSILPDLKQTHYIKTLEALYSYEFPLAKALYIETYSMGYSHDLIKILEKATPNKDFSNAFFKIASCINKVKIEDWTNFRYTDSRTIYKILNQYSSDHSSRFLVNDLTNVIELYTNEELEYSKGSTCMYSNTYTKLAIVL